MAAVGNRSFGSTTFFQQRGSYKAGPGWEQPCSTQLLLCQCIQDAGGAERWLETTSCSRLTNYKVSLRADELLGFLCL